MSPISLTHSSPRKTKCNKFVPTIDASFTVSNEIWHSLAWHLALLSLTKTIANTLNNVEGRMEKKGDNSKDWFESVDMVRTN